MDTVQIKKENAIKAYNNGCADVKKVLSNLLGDELFTPKDIKTRVKSFDDACDVLGMTVTKTNCGEIKSKVLTDGDHKSIDAYGKLIIIARALNEGWVPDWKNSSQYKYYPWFDLSSGSGLRCGGFGYRNSGSFGGSRLCFKSRELAEYAGTQFIDLYTEFFII